jgi:23S rRNA pseudouridine1911/1915/1917 synthase
MTEPHVIALAAAEADAGERLDRFIAAAVPELSRSQAQQLIAAGMATVNGRPARSSYPLRPGDALVLTIPPPQPIELRPEDIPLNIVHEDADIVVVDKPAGMVVHPAPGHSGGTLVNALLGRYPDLQIGGELRPGIVHRLDQGTSGLLVVARNDRAMRALTEQQRERRMRKIYLAVVEGRMKVAAGTVDAPIARHPNERLRMAVVPGGREARTHYRLLEELGLYSLLELQLESGRTHQIRVHMQHISRPVLGDQLYTPRRGRPTLGLERQFLHAHQLGFFHPASAEWVEFSSPLPPDLQLVLDRLRRGTVSKGQPGPQSGNTNG